MSIILIGTEIDPEMFGAIQFIDVPPGAAPLKYRSAFVGKRVQCLFKDDDNSVSIDAISYEIDPPHASYVVLQEEALAVLREDSPEALNYWIKAGYPWTPDAAFSFDLSCAKVVKRVPSEAEFWRLCLNS
jgi:hypothetical protein